MKRYYLRLDDACEKMDVEKWNRIEAILDKYNIKPLVGVIPHCEDPSMDRYSIDGTFWDKVQSWVCKGWVIAMHGYNHVYSTNYGGINPINKRSEFAGEPLDIQKDKIRKGFGIFEKHGIYPAVFFAPSHTFDENTLLALKEESDIRIISDTIAWDSYWKDEFLFIPQQSGMVRKLPFKTTTFCYHPNSLSDKGFVQLENFLKKNRFARFEFDLKKRKLSLFDYILRRLYFLFHR